MLICTALRLRRLEIFDAFCDCIKVTLTTFEPLVTPGILGVLGALLGLITMGGSCCAAGCCCGSAVPRMSTTAASVESAVSV
jgi:hypothetical protein